MTLKVISESGVLRCSLTVQLFVPIQSGAGAISRDHLIPPSTVETHIWTELYDATFADSSI